MSNSFLEIAKSVQFAIRISNVQLILRNCEIAKSVQFAIIIFTVQVILGNCEINSVCYQNLQCSVDFANSRYRIISSVCYPDSPYSVDFVKSLSKFRLLSGFPLFS